MKRLFIDQHRNCYYALNRKDLMKQFPGHVSIMYSDKKDGRTVRCGYVIGQYWLKEYTAVESSI